MFDPEEPYTPSGVQRQVAEPTGRTEQFVTDSRSAVAVDGDLAPLHPQWAAQPSLVGKSAVPTQIIIYGDEGRQCLRSRE